MEARRSSSGPAVGRLTESAHFIHDDHHPACQPLDNLKIENYPVIAGLDEIEKIAGELANL